MTITAADNHARYQHQADSHYENFPVASWLLPPALRHPVSVIYAFARNADDFADEGDMGREERLAKLDDYRNRLYRIQRNEPVNDPLFPELKKVIDAYDLPYQAFHDLLSAFSQDVDTSRYPSRETLLDYCSRSANPVGLLLLHLVKRIDPQAVQESNAICSALQIINFLQDISVDYEKGRIYLPLNELEQFGIAEHHIAGRIFDDNWRRFISFQLDQVEQLMRFGALLPCRLPGRMKYEIRATVVSGLQVIKLLRKRNRAGFTNQPRLRLPDWVMIAFKTIFYPCK